MASRSVTFASAEAEDQGEGPLHEISQTTAPSKISATSRSVDHLICPNCGSKEIEQHDASGASICTDCGVVVEENAIVSAVEFVEGVGGSSNMVGQFVSATSSKAYTGGPPQAGGRGSRYGFSRDSRETTLANGRRRIQEVASRLRLSSQFVDAAHRLFTIAVEKNFVQGRRTTHVVAACLYIACRQEKSQHMLIDFSDALQTNVYTLGTCFLKFRRLLGLKLEIIDPALYIYRFAAHLDLDEKANAVSMTALRLVARMKRDWIVTGRRPAGICAAALLIAARAHGFSKHHQDVTRILRVCGLTVSSRVREFERTSSARLTLDQFNSGLELQTEADPPVFVRNRIREARAKAIEEGNVELLESGALDDPLHSGKRARRWREDRPDKPKQVQFKEMYASLDKELPDNSKDTESEATGEESPSSERQLVISDKVQVVGGEWKNRYPRDKHGKSIVLPEQSTEEERMAPTAPVEAKISLDEWKKDMPLSITKEVDDIFRSDEEERKMEEIFNKINKDFLIQQERKESARLSAEAATANQEKDDAAQVEGHARYKSNRGRKRKGTEDQTTEEKLMAAMSTRKVSRKINYDALSSIFDDDGSFSTDIGNDGGLDADPDLYEMV